MLQRPAIRRIREIRNFLSKRIACCSGSGRVARCIRGTPKPRWELSLAPLGLDSLNVNCRERHNSRLEVTIEASASFTRVDKARNLRPRLVAPSNDRKPIRVSSCAESRPLPVHQPVAAKAKLAANQQSAEISLGANRSQREALGPAQLALGRD